VNDLDLATLATLATEVKDAQDHARSILPLTTRFPDFDLAAAYRLAHLVHGTRLAEGARSVGRKIGFTNPAMWSVYGVTEPIWAHLYESTVVQLKGTFGTCHLDRFVEPKIEPEIVFGFREAPQAGTSVAGIAETVEWVAHGFEIVQSHFPGWRFKAPDTIADQSLHAALLVGPRQPVAALGDGMIDALASCTVTLFRDGQPVESGSGTNALGSPLAAIAHLLSVLREQPHAAPMQVGEIVTTGTLTAAHPVRAGENWHSVLEGINLPGLSVKFTS
jgi:2-keto-4-pentenoate hydratase